MTEEGDDLAQGTPRRPRIVVTFKDGGSADCDVNIEPGVGPLQLYGIAEFLRFHAELMLRQQMVSRIVRPK